MIEATPLLPFPVVLNKLSTAVFEANEKGIILSANTKALQLFRAHRPLPLISDCLFDLIITKEMDLLQSNFKRAFEGHNCKFEIEVETLGAPKLQAVEFIRQTSEVTQKPIVLGLLNDITQFKSNEQLLNFSQKKYSSLIKNMPDSLFELDTLGRVSFLNHLPQAFFLDQLLGEPFEDCLTLLDQKKLFKETFEALLAKPETKDIEITALSLAGDTYYWELRLTPILMDNIIQKVILIIQDVTEKKRIEKERTALLEALFQSQKLESLGRLAGGVAHEFNNLLAISLLHCVLLKQQIQKNPQALETIEVIEKASRRAEELTSQLLGFARKGKYAAKPMAIDGLLDEAMKLIQSSFLSQTNIELELIIEPHLPKIVASENQILQCLINLAINAIDAMPSGGKIIFEAFKTTQILKAQPTPCLALSIRDTGHGISSDIINQIFDPFFTTKEIGKGTGLGLSMIYGIMENHEGCIRVESNPNEGSTFTLVFPSYEEQP